MKKGFTTGTAAAAAAKAAVLRAKTGTCAPSVSVTLPDGRAMDLPVLADASSCYVIKDGGDDIDATHGMAIHASAHLHENPAITVTGGVGIGTVTRPGLQVLPGNPAINPVPRSMIESNVRDVLGAAHGADITIFAPAGKAVAEKTFNRRLGITGGISIIGTTGIVEPMSIDALKQTIACEIDVAAASGDPLLALVPGRIGETALRRTMPDITIVQMSNYVGHALSHAHARGFTRIILAGHPGKLAKIVMGHYDTHSKHSPPAAEFMASLLELDAAPNTVEEVCTPEYAEQFFALAHAIADRITRDFGFEAVSVVLYDMNRTRLAFSGKDVIA